MSGSNRPKKTEDDYKREWEAEKAALPIKPGLDVKKQRTLFANSNRPKITEDDCEREWEEKKAALPIKPGLNVKKQRTLFVKLRRGELDPKPVCSQDDWDLNSRLRKRQ